MRYWHYTVYQSFQGIIKARVIRPAVCGIEHGETAVVWFSTNPVWEETVRKAIRYSKTGKQTGPLSRDELFKHGFPPVRIEANPERVTLYSWHHFRKNGGISSKQVRNMSEVAAQWGAHPKQWWISYEPVPLTSCLDPIEIWDGSKWVDIVDVLQPAA